MTGYACGSGGVMFVPDTIERKEPKEAKVEPSKKKHRPVKITLSNDHDVSRADETIAAE